MQEKRIVAAHRAANLTKLLRCVSDKCWELQLAKDQGRCDNFK